MWVGKYSETNELSASMQTQLTITCFPNQPEFWQDAARETRFANQGYAMLAKSDESPSRVELETLSPYQDIVPLWLQVLQLPPPPKYSGYLSRIPYSYPIRNSASGCSPKGPPSFSWRFAGPKLGHVITGIESKHDAPPLKPWY